MKKTQYKITPSNIIKTFCKNPNQENIACRNCDIKAIYVYYKKGKNVIFTDKNDEFPLTIEYLTKIDLEFFLKNFKDKPPGILQKWVNPNTFLIENFWT